MKIYRVFLLAALTSYGTLTLTAHHSVNKTYDSTNPVTLSGTIKDSKWANPHVQMDLEVANAGGKTTVWLIEMAGPRKLFETHLDSKLIAPGQRVSVEAWPARDGRKEAAGRVLITADGTRWDVHDIWSELEVAK